MITRVTGKNQVTVPAEIARMQGIRAGTRLDWQPTNEAHMLRVHVVPDPATLASGLRGAGRKYKKCAAGAVGNLIRERDREDFERK